MNRLTSAALASICLFMSSCAQNWDAAQRATLSSVAVPTPVIDKNAYHVPTGKMPAGPTPVVVVPGAGFGAGAVGNGLGQLVVEGIGAVQQSMYENANKEAISRVSGTLPGDIPQRVRKTVVAKLDSDSFFKGKVTDKSSNRLVVTISSYGYVRTTKVDGKILVAPQTTGSFELTDAAGKSLLKQQVSAVAALKGHPLEDFANDPKLASDAFDLTFGGIADQIAAAINLKAGDAGQP